MRPLPALLALAVLAAGCLGAPQPQDPPAPDAGDRITERGYLAMEDGVLLAYTAVLPGPGRWPMLFEYSGYNPGTVPDQGYIARYLPRGFGFVGVNVRGTGCSGGVFDFFEPQQAKDGAAAVEWIARQDWSDGRVAMVGKSFPGITQLFVAAERPPHLVAIAPGHAFGDAYRDVAYPGGIFNHGFAALWTFVAQPAPGTESALRESPEDEVCARNQLDHAGNARTNAFLQAQEHPFDDALIRERSPTYLVDRIAVPLFTVIAWQDEQVGPRSAHMLEKVQAPWWAIVTNGDHGMYRTEPALQVLDAFLDRFVKGVANGFEQRPRLTVWWEAAEQARAPAWTTQHEAWPPAVVPLALHLRAGGTLAPEAPEADAPTTWLYPSPGPTNAPGYGTPLQGLGERLDGLPSAPTRPAWRTAPLAEDLVLLGSANLTLWLDSTSPELDVQVTLRDVGPEGATLIQHGWLRASHRALNDTASRPLLPVQLHTGLDPVVPGEPFELNIEVFPFGHALRAGHRLEVGLESPNALPELWGLASPPAPAVVRVLHDAAHPSRLLLPALPGVDPPGPAPGCGSLVRQPCGPP